ncbi:MAG: TonB-dependent receptor, partial [Muribaculaceae bacterium]|nr:TonB-dependent receptor [Muribaculaceae bacterium]
GDASPYTPHTQERFADPQSDHTNKGFRPSTSTQAINAGRDGQASRSYSKERQYILEWITNFSARLGKNNIKAMVGYSYQYSQYEGFSVNNADFPNDGLNADNIGTGEFAKDEGEVCMSSYKNDAKLISFFGRVSYDWDGKYLVTASLRHEGSSKFGANNKWGNFPAVSAGWRISQEEFMEGSHEWLNDLKIRADYGETGNQDFGSYNSLNTMSGFGYYLYNGKFIQVWGPSKNVNPNLRWEKGKNWNVGVDFSMFNNRFYGSLNYFNRRTQDLLGNYKVPVPPYLHDETFVNVGTMKNTGFEVDLSFNAVQTKEFDYNFNVIGTTMSNKFVDFSNSEYVGQDYYNVCGTEDPYPFYNLQRIEKGESVGNFFMWRYAGINEDGEWLVYDKDSDIINASQASEADRQKVGNGMPKFTLSTTHNFRYRNFDLSLFFRGAFCYDIFNIHDFYYGTRKFTGNVLKKAYGKNFAISPTSSHAVTDYFLERGDYFKLDQITLGYTLNVPQWRFIDKIRLYGTMKNVFTITKFSGVDPSSYQVNGLEPGAQGSRKYFPSTRQFILGVQLDF